MIRIMAALAALVLALPAGAAAQDPQASLADIEDEVMCPICGTTLELSASPQADRQREFIRGQIGQGRSKDEIKDALVAESGEDVLAVPDSEGFDLTAWVVQILGIALAVGGVGLAIARFSRRHEDGGAEPALAPEQDARIDREMSKLDL